MLMLARVALANALKESQTEADSWRLESMKLREELEQVKEVVHALQSKDSSKSATGPE